MRSLRFVTPLLLGLSCAVVPAATHAQVTIGITVGVAPPPLPIYAQPPMPAMGYIWTPGYWAWGPDGYYWVPGTWVLPPAPGLLWTPGYWAWENTAFVWIPGYWAPTVGFYGGIDYGFGYFGAGFVGGYWHEGRFFYNRTYNNFGRLHVANVYNRPVNVRRTYVSYNGGRGGIMARPTGQQAAFAREAHTPPTRLQMQHVQAAAGNRALWNSVNHGRPPIAATSEPGRFDRAGGGRPAGEAPAGGYHPPATPGRPAPAGGYHPPAATGRPAPNGGYHPPAATGHPVQPGRYSPPAPGGHPGPVQHGPGVGRPGPAPYPQQGRPVAPPQYLQGRPPAQGPRGPAARPNPQPGPRPAERQGGERRDQQHP